MSFTINITASFTADLILEPFKFWMELLNQSSDICITPYNQIIGQLADPESEFNRNTLGVNIVLYNPEDVIRFVENESSFETLAEKIEKNCKELVEAIDSHQDFSRVPLLFVLSPQAFWLENQVLDAATITCYNLLESTFKEHTKIHIISQSYFKEKYHIENYIDRRSNLIGHIPQLSSRV